MIVFAPLRARRLDVRMKELSIGDEIALCHLPENLHEKALTEFLTRAIDSANAPSARHVSDPRAWSVGERLLALAHYCAHTREDKPDYAVTDVSNLSDYLDAAKDFPKDPARFTALDDKWVLQPLTGAALETLEVLQGESPLQGREFWLLGAMAAQLLREGEQHPDPVSDHADYAEWLQERIATMRGLPASGFDVLYGHYRAALDRDMQFFQIWFDEQGVVVLPKEAGAVTPAARFLVLSCVGTVALSVTGKA